jgi:hypothetical protein
VGQSHNLLGVVEKAASGGKDGDCMPMLWQQMSDLW